jgi:hypothetical protein
MAKFLVLFQSSVKASDQMASSTPEQMQAGMASWMKWKEALEAQGGKMEFGSPLEARKDIVADGTVTDCDMPVSGYLIVDDRTLDETVEALKSHPHLEMVPDAKIDVIEMMPMPGMSHEG